MIENVRWIAEARITRLSGEIQDRNATTAQLQANNRSLAIDIRSAEATIKILRIGADRAWFARIMEN